MNQYVEKLTVALLSFIASLFVMFIGFVCLSGLIVLLPKSICYIPIRSIILLNGMIFILGIPLYSLKNAIKNNW